MKPEELRNMTEAELRHKITALKEELSKIIFQGETSNIEKPSRVSQIKRDIARIMTIIKETSYAK